MTPEFITDVLKLAASAAGLVSGYLTAFTITILVRSHREP